MGWQVGVRDGTHHRIVDILNVLSATLASVLSGTPRAKGALGVSANNIG